jgi:cation/acetate symporter
MLLGETGLSGMAGVLAGAIGLPCGLATAFVASLLTPGPGRNVLDIVHDTRVPGGETLYDREMRLLRLKSRP